MVRLEVVVVIKHVLDENTDVHGKFLYVYLG